MNFSHTFIKAIKDGQVGWKDPRPRGHLKIREDNKTLFYKLLNKKDLKNFKLWFENISETQYGNKARLVGNIQNMN